MISNGRVSYALRAHVRDRVGNEVDVLLDRSDHGGQHGGRARPRHAEEVGEARHLEPEVCTRPCPSQLKSPIN